MWHGEFDGLPSQGIKPPAAAGLVAARVGNTARTKTKTDARVSGLLQGGGGSLLESPHLCDVELSVGYPALIVQKDVDLGVPLDAGDGIDSNLPHAHPPVNRTLPLSPGQGSSLYPFAQYK